MCGVALGEGEDSLEAIPEVPAGSTMGDQSWDAEVPQVPQATCLVEVLKECECAVAGEEIHQVAGDGGHSIKDSSALGPLLPKWLQRQVLAERGPVGGGERRKETGLQLLGIPPCFDDCARAPLDVGGGIEVEGL